MIAPESCAAAQKGSPGLVEDRRSGGENIEDRAAKPHLHDPCQLLDSGLGSMAREEGEAHQAVRVGLAEVLGQPRVKGLKALGFELLVLKRPAQEVVDHLGVDAVPVHVLQPVSRRPRGEIRRAPPLSGIPKLVNLLTIPAASREPW